MTLGDLAAWLNNLIAVVALVVALIALVREEKRAHADARRAREVEIRRSDDLIEAAVRLLADASAMVCRYVDVVAQRPRGFAYSGAEPIETLMENLAPTIDVLGNLRRLVPPDMGLAFSLSRGYLALVDIREFPRRRVNYGIPELEQLLQEKASTLDQASKQLTKRKRARAVNAKVEASGGR